MNKLASGLAAIAVLIGAPAFAAPVTALPAASAPGYNWTGWYVGVNAGASFGRAQTDFNVTPIGTTAVPGVPALQNSPGFGFSDTNSATGFIGGGQIGYNYQLSPIWVVGLEADFQGVDEKAHGHVTNSFGAFVRLSGAIASTRGTSDTNYSTQVDWVGTVRGRVGYVFGHGAVMSYVTAGLAYGGVKISGTNTVNAILNSVGSLPAEAVGQAFDHSQVNTGWVVGYGMEGRLLMPGWTYRVEGLYMDLGTLDASGATSSVFTALAGASATGGQVTTHSHFTDVILRAGLNYQFR